ncbi:2OG-Fe(II) oxygenase [Mycobacterium sp. CBMA293]|uniref:2OG-Fe(II) oxygenase n=1 Tax=unclassified Mycolicibacterium TaxID=2636767 RepID=UPI0012DCBADB|nr:MULTISPECIES: 2OG-Fe(II) oxygenase [unclassified Mycolicibacterium]MUL47838.1 2OG-Fe(II) oxygenase [Mycolicibacterium sp. CBMA 360]MUL59315.1 2OG-Fe(II) oxygenase [Mycolicibacterium sp. CBMA 335]MUL71040.1 2OG-Fe(II) oxygenase [Mycolicibacterium sp. CBMA 311]MUL94683.1 2OG-Fe(II) oxygenase [Mycolicibacterium sp. CBMA 230]MUM09139.1 proline hydroxylase [Mycolicibacterium sp. CBMA 213]
MIDVTNFAFTREELFPIADAHREEFRNADPFPHVVIDNFLPPAVLEPVLSEFPEPGAAEWQQYDSGREVKLALADSERMGPATRLLLAQFNSGPFVDFIERLTGIDGIVPDPHFFGGGLHQIRTGGFLKVHADFNRHDRLNLDRRLNGLLYLNKDWEEAWGGHIQLWDRKMERCAHKSLPIFNRFLLFATTDFSYHGHPDPLTCPPHRSRRSMALYYYTNGRPDEEKALGEHSTLFRSRPGESLNSTFKQELKRWVPPAVLEGLQRFRNRH